ncbi:MAG: Flp pilus assembly complex ATPase component TadA [Bacteriovoracaceae bacterium]|nr:Flp pilus assembly complex ATPase component TadA [Bacteriovoracaceae bacterium]
MSIDGPLILIGGKVTATRVPSSRRRSAKPFSIDSKGRFTDAKICLITAGNAGSGKTSIANLLVEAIDPSWRVVTAEKVAELNTTGRKRTLRLETPRCKQSEMVELIQKAAILRADTLVISELMGAEAFEATKIMREGFSVLATIAAEGASDALKKCELFCLMGQYGIGVDEIKYHVASGVDIVIFQERLKSGKRVVSNISAVEGLDENGRYSLKPLFVYNESESSYETTKEGEKFLK